MKQRIPLMMVFLVSVFMVVQYFVPHDSFRWIYSYMLDWTIIIGIFAILLGIYSLLRLHYFKIRNRSENWVYSYVTLFGLFAMIVAGFWPFWPFGGFMENYWYVHLFDYILVPIQATMFSILAFFIASAAFRAFRARSIVATLILLAATIIMIRFVPLGFLSEPIADLAGWILRVPNLAAKRAIIIGVGLGAVTMALKVMLGIERAYLGRD